MEITVVRLHFSALRTHQQFDTGAWPKKRLARMTGIDGAEKNSQNERPFALPLIVWPTIPRGVKL
jgi:hypothetical protein